MVVVVVVVVVDLFIFQSHRIEDYLCLCMLCSTGSESLRMN